MCNSLNLLKEETKGERERELQRNRKIKNWREKKKKNKNKGRGGLDIALPQILGRVQCCPLFCPENRSKNRDIVPGLAQYSVERVPTGPRIIIDTRAAENKLTSATKRPNLKKNNRALRQTLVNHEFSIGQSHASAIINWQLMENCRKTPSFPNLNFNNFHFNKFIF